MLEGVQHHFTRLFSELRAMSYEARLEILWLWSLEERRNRLDLIDVYKIMHGFNDVPVSTFFQTTADSHTHGHSMKLAKSYCHTDLRLYLFSHRVVSSWNTLFRRLWVHLQSTASRDIWILHDKRWVSLWTPGPHNSISCWLWRMFGNGLIWCFIIGAATPGELPGELTLSSRRLANLQNRQLALDNLRLPPATLHA